MNHDPEAGRAVRVTVVYHNDVMRELLDEVLTSLGFRVEQFAAATADLRTLLASRPELVMVELALDPHREGLSGLQTIHAARSTDQLRDVPLIVCSADVQALAEAWPDFMERGDIQRLELPFDLATLEQVIGSARGETRARDLGFMGTTIASGGTRVAPTEGTG